MKTKQLSIRSEFYVKLLDHCQKQYKNINRILNAYGEKGQCFAIDYVGTDGKHYIAKDTEIADIVINFY